MSGNTLTIGIHFDLICPWCLIGKQHLMVARDRFAQHFPDVAVETVWHPVQLLPDVPPQGLPFTEFYLRRLGSPEAVRQRQQQVAMAARHAGLDLDMTRIARMPNTARAHALLRQVSAMAAPALYEALLDRLFAAYFQRGEDIGDPATLQRLALECGVPAERFDVATPSAGVPAPAASAITGVPHFVFNGGLAVSGAQPAETLLESMSLAMQAADPTASA